MPFINVKLIEGVFSSEQKAQIIRKLTDTMVEIEGEAMRSEIGRASCRERVYSSV